MITKQVMLAGLAAIVLGVGAAQAGPCNTGGKDAGSGPTPGYTGQTTTGTSSAKADQHPPTETMNRMAGEKATSSQDTQRQQQGQPTVAQRSAIVLVLLYAKQSTEHGQKPACQPGLFSN
jgi:hypothetical protein